MGQPTPLMCPAWARTLLPDSVPLATYDAANRQFAFGAQAMTFDDNGNLLTQRGPFRHMDPTGALTFVVDALDGTVALANQNLVLNPRGFIPRGLPQVRHTGEGRYPETQTGFRVKHGMTG